VPVRPNSNPNIHRAFVSVQVGNVQMQKIVERFARISCLPDFRMPILFAIVSSLCVPFLAQGREPFVAFLVKHCISCHGPDKEKGVLRVDHLSRDFKLGADSHHWAEVIE
jgi:hypothetical protein